MKKNFLYKTVILSGLLMVFSCDQDAIFYKVSTETIPEKPRIQGAPTNMVVFERKGTPIMYVASGNLHWYAKTEDGTGAWDSPEYSIPQPGGKVIGLAATIGHLYALSIFGTTTTKLQRIGPAEDEWTEISVDESDESKYTLLQSIYATDTGKLFAGAMNNKDSDFGILYLDDTSAPLAPTLKLLQTEDSNTEMLSGAAFKGGVYYLSTRGKGVYKVESDLSTATRLVDIDDPESEGKQNRLFMGMIKLEDESIIVVERTGGAFYEIRADGFQQIKYNSGNNIATGRFATGALALWQEVIYDKDDDDLFSIGTKKMLIAGIQGGLYSTTTNSSYTHGYTEFDLKDDGSLDLDSTRTNNSPSITVQGHTDRYSATIGKHPINHMFQVPDTIDKKIIFFASTQTGGLWSYRLRSDGIQWNAEN